MHSNADTGPVNQGLSIAEAADLTGLTADTLRYYERDGLMLRSVPRATSGHRQYADDDIHWIRLITKLRSTGMPIRDVRRYADLVRAGEGNEQGGSTCSARTAGGAGPARRGAGPLGAIDYKIGIYEDRLNGCGGAVGVASVAVPRWSRRFPLVAPP